ncbi:MAG: GAF domain-containing protein [Ramlibacter sp.]
MSAYTRGERHALQSIGQRFAIATSDQASQLRYDAIRTLLNQVREALHMDVVFVSEFVDGQRLFRCVDAAEGEGGAVVEGNSDPLAQSYCLRVVDGRLPQAIPDAMASPEALALPATRAVGIGAHLSVPIVLRTGQVFGTLCCFSHQAHPALGSADAAALSAIAELIAAGIDARGALRDTLWLRAPDARASRPPASR